MNMAFRGPERDTFQVYRPEWSNLPEEIVRMILDEVLEPINFIRFAVVCKEWHCHAKHYYHHTGLRYRLNKALPLLLIPSEFKEVGDAKTRGKVLSCSLYNVSERRVYINNLKSPILPHGTSNRLVGCSHGWLATLDEQHMTIALTNPFRKSIAPILLPSLKTPQLYLPQIPQKVFLSADPAMHPDSCFVVVNFCENKKSCAYRRLGQGQDNDTQPWTLLVCGIDAFSDAIFSKGLVYRSRLNGSIFASSTQRSVAYPPMAELKRPGLGLFIDSYLVESITGGIWHARRYFPGRKGLATTQSFEVSKVEIEITKEVEVQSIGNEALFISNTNSFSVLASEIPGCRPNSIYYYGDDNDCVMSVFSLDSQTSTKQNDSHIIRCSDDQPAVWITPQISEPCWLQLL